MSDRLFGWDLPPGVSPSDIDPPLDWSEQYETELAENEVETFEELCQDDQLYALVTKVVAWAEKRGHDEAMAAAAEDDAMREKRYVLEVRPIGTLSWNRLHLLPSDVSSREGAVAYLTAYVRNWEGRYAEARILECVKVASCQEDGAVEAR